MPINPSDEFKLNPDQLDEMKSLAAKGDGGAGFRLWEYYSFAEYDEQESNYWLELSAKLNNPIAQYNMASMSYRRKNFDAADFWAKKAIENGEQDAKKFLLNPDIK